MGACRMSAPLLPEGDWIRGTSIKQPWTTAIRTARRRWRTGPQELRRRVDRGELHRGPPRPVRFRRPGRPPPRRRPRLAPPCSHHTLSRSPWGGSSCSSCPAPVPARRRSSRPTPGSPSRLRPAPDLPRQPRSVRDRGRQLCGRPVRPGEGHRPGQAGLFWLPRRHPPSSGASPTLTSPRPGCGRRPPSAIASGCTSSSWPGSVTTASCLSFQPRQRRGPLWPQSPLTSLALHSRPPLHPADADPQFRGDQGARRPTRTSRRPSALTPRETNAVRRHRGYRILRYTARATSCQPLRLHPFNLSSQLDKPGRTATTASPHPAGRNDNCVICKTEPELAPSELSRAGPTLSYRGGECRSTGCPERTATSPWL